MVNPSKCVKGRAESVYQGITCGPGVSEVLPGSPADDAVVVIQG